MTKPYENLNVTCADQYLLAARFYPAQTDSKLKPILISPATGITMNFYNTFATWLAEQGYPVMSFDFRGIGQSLHGKLKDSKASIQDWGQLDLPAMIDALCEKTRTDHILMIGHSAGGQLLGITPNHSKIEKLVAIAGSTGNVKNLKGRTKLLAPLMFKVIFPIARFTIGYGPTQKIGMGENLPKDVAKQWAEFCSQPGYVINAIGKTIFDDFHAQVQTPITALWASDDEIATEANVKDLLRLYPASNTQMIEIMPSAFNHNAIGHMSMFKRSHQNIWLTILENIQTS